MDDLLMIEHKILIRVVWLSQNALKDAYNIIGISLILKTKSNDVIISMTLFIYIFDKNLNDLLNRDCLNCHRVEEIRLFLDLMKFRDYSIITIECITERIMKSKILNRKLFKSVKFQSEIQKKNLHDVASI